MVWRKLLSKHCGMLPHSRRRVHKKVLQRCICNPPLRSEDTSSIFDRGHMISCLPRRSLENWVCLWFCCCCCCSSSSSSSTSDSKLEPVKGGLENHASFVFESLCDHFSFPFLRVFFSPILHQRINNQLQMKFGVCVWNIEEGCMKMRLGFESGFLSDTEGDKMKPHKCASKKKKSLERWRRCCFDLHSGANESRPVSGWHCANFKVKLHKKGFMVLHVPISLKK